MSGLSRQIGCRTSPPGQESIPGHLKRFTNTDSAALAAGQTKLLNSSGYLFHHPLHLLWVKPNQTCLISATLSLSPHPPTLNPAAFQPLFKVEPILLLPHVGPVSDLPHLLGQLLKNTLLSYSNLLVSARK